MRRKIAVLLLAFLLLALTACSRNPTGTEVQIIVTNSGMVRAVYDYDAQTITVGGDVVTITVEGEGVPDWGDTSAEDLDVYHYEYDSGDITITYPNGATWWESATKTGAVSGWDGDYGTQRYIDGSALALYLTEAYDPPVRDGVIGMAFMCLVVVILGIFMIKAPDSLMQLRYGLWFHNVEPTEHAILATRVSGVVLIVGAVVLFLMAAFG